MQKSRFVFVTRKLPFARKKSPQKSPFSVKKEIEEDQNQALAIIIGALIIGIAIIVASAING